MGYTSCDNWRSKKDVIDSIKSEITRCGCELIECCSPVNYFAALVKAKDGKKFVHIVLIERQGGRFWEKTMDHKMGVPCYDIPVSWLDQVEITGYAVEWAEQVRAFKSTRLVEKEETKKIKATLKIGSSITLPEKYKSMQLTVIDIQPRKVLAVNCYGTTYRVPKNLLRLSQIS